MKLKIALPIVAILFSFNAFSTHPDKTKERSAAEIYQELLKFKTVGKVLYLAAHPDDENTRLIAYFENYEHINTGYLSLTRGDGGQNLIGTEKGAALGILRTQELLEARKTDGGKQYFTRAVDFGYSKTTTESLDKWDSLKVLSDVVWVIRNVRPDVIITRFPPDKNAGHGHHSSSAVLAEIAFKLAGDATAFPEQLQYIKPWSPTRLYMNTGRWWYKNIEEEAANNPDIIRVDVGKYSETLGLSIGEIAALSRSKHQSQGFGSGLTRGEILEYLKYVAGSKAANNNIFDGINTKWTRIKGAEKILSLTDQVIQKFLANPFHPENIVPALIGIHEQLEKLPKDPTITEKMAELKKLIFNCAGIFTEATAPNYYVTNFDSLAISFSAVNRSNLNVVVKSVAFNAAKTDSAQVLQENKLQTFDLKSRVNYDPNYFSPYWLQNGYTNMYEVNNLQLIGKPENAATFFANAVISINGKEFMVNEPVYYKWVDDAKGELYRPCIFVPKMTVNLTESAYILKAGSDKKVTVKVKSFQKLSTSELHLNMPSGWSCTPTSFNFEIENEGAEQTFDFMVKAPNGESNGTIEPYIASNKSQYTDAWYEINYSHILPQTYFLKSKSQLVSLNVAIKGSTIGYIKGAGDEIPAALNQLGYAVTDLDIKSIKAEDLKSLDAIIIGIRAYNVVPELAFQNKVLFDYVNKGGTLVIQYNTSRETVTEELTPYPLKLGRDRVTEEDAKATLLQTDHELFTTPNKIEEADFDNWVQERGLYFASEWDAQFKALISWNDTNEKPLEGGLLVADYGKGKVIFTGISFFRQLPAGVPGAFKLFANIVSYGK